MTITEGRSELHLSASEPKGPKKCPTRVSPIMAVLRLLQSKSEKNCCCVLRVTTASLQPAGQRNRSSWERGNNPTSWDLPLLQGKSTQKWSVTAFSSSHSAQHQHGARRTGRQTAPALSKPRRLQGTRRGLDTGSHTTRGVTSLEVHPSHELRGGSL